MALSNLKTYSITYSGYNEVYTKDIVLPDTEWVMYKGLISMKYKDHVNYWTIIPKTYANMRWMAEYGDAFGISTYCFCDMILITLAPCAKIPELKIISHKKLFGKYKLDTLTAVTINDQYQVSNVYRLEEMQHPMCANVKCISFRSIMHEPITNAEKYFNCELFKWLNHSKNKVCILSGHQAYHIWDQAWHKFENDFVGEIDYLFDIFWSIEDYGFKIPDSKKDISMEDLEEMVSAGIKFMSQFGSKF